MFSYENGLVIAFFLWLIGTIHILVSINSKLQRNLNKIGQRLSWITLSPKPMEAEDLSRSAFSKTVKFIFISGIGLISALLSWLYVAMFLGAFIYKRMKDAGAPQAVREFRWKLRNADLSFDQLAKELMKVLEHDPANFEKFREDLVQDLKNQGL
jgi:hypothetical protein